MKRLIAFAILLTPVVAGCASGDDAARKQAIIDSVASGSTTAATGGNEAVELVFDWPDRLVAELKMDWKTNADFGGYDAPLAAYKGLQECVFERVEQTFELKCLDSSATEGSTEERERAEWATNLFWPFVMNQEGEFVELIDPERSKRIYAEQTATMAAASEDPAQTRKLMSKFDPTDELNGNARRFARAIVGVWQGKTLAPGETRGARLNNDLIEDATIGIQGWVPCDDTSDSANCVLGRIEAEMAVYKVDLIVASLEMAGARDTKVDHAFEVHEIVFDPTTLIPHRYEMAATIESRSNFRGERAAVTYRDSMSADFAYIP